MKKISLLVLLLVLFLQARSQDILSRYDSAILLIEKAQLVPAVNVFKSIKDELYSNQHYDEYFAAQYFLAVYYALVERNAKAAEDSLRLNLNKAIEISGERSAGAAEMYFGLAWLHDKARETPLAEENYKKALDIQEEIFGASHKKTIKTKTNYAQVLTQSNKLGRVEKYLIELMKSYPEVYEANHPEYVRLYTLAFNFYQSTSEREKELSYALAAFEIGEINYGPSNERVLSLLRNVSYAYYESQNIDRAIDFAKKELELVNALIGNAPHIRRAEILNNMGRFYDSGKQYELSISHYENALKIKKELLGREHPVTLNTAINLTMTLNKVDRLDESNRHLKSIMNMLQASKTDKFENNYIRATTSLIENLSLVGNRDSVWSLFEEQYSLFQKNLNRSILAGDKHANMMSMLEDLSILSNHQSVPIEELHSISEKIHWLDSINTETFKRINLKSDQLIFLENYAVFNAVVMDHFFELYSRTQDEKFANEILKFSEKNKATILSPEYSIARLKDALNIPIETLEEERRLLSELSADSDINQQVLLEKKLAYDSIVLILKTNYEDYYNLKYAAPKVSIALIQTKLPENSLLLSYAFSQKHLYTISINDSTYVIQRQEIGALAEEIVAFRNKTIALDDLEDDSKKLFNRLIPATLNDQQLIISIQDFLAFLPFELLHNGNDFVGLANPISYSPSINMWMNSLKFDPYSNSQVLAMAPSFEGQNALNEDANRDLLVPIPGAEKEIRIMQEFFNGKYLIDDEATKDVFIENVSDFGIVHLATHAIIDNDNPNLSRLYFSGSVDEEPYIRNYELYNLDINANLVTLSACNTGIGEIQKGDGVNSLARGFIYAGVPATVVSLWPASDKSTPELMEYFYKNLKDGQTKDIALNNARKQYLATAKGKARHPFYWGGFVLIGDNSPIEEDTKLLVYLIPSILIIVMILTVYRRKKSRSS